MDIFTQDKPKDDFSKAVKADHHIYDYVFTDSKNERDFVRELDTSTAVVVYAKLPRGFFIPTPVGNYNPDWAIAFQEGKVKHVYFVAETKGSMSSMDLRKIEESKIECARKFFDVIDFRAFEVLHAQWIDQQLHAVTAEHVIVIRARFVETETVLEARAAATLDEHAQLECGIPFFRDQLAHSPERGVGNPDSRFAGGGNIIHACTSAP